MVFLIIPQAQRLLDDFGLRPVTASEIEFYLRGSEEEMRARCAEAELGIFKIEKERGENQYEIALLPVADPARTARDTQTLKSILTPIADFSARPFAGQPGSGLHIHVHLEDASGKNVFFKNDAAISDALKHAIGGLLAFLPDSMPVFAPSEKSYERFARAEAHTPTTVSWGANNRTVAVRLPDKVNHEKHIEHRISGADADPAKVMAVIIAAMHYGLKNKIDPGQQIYGDASLAQYDLPKLPTSLQEAREQMARSELIKKYFLREQLL